MAIIKNSMSKTIARDAMVLDLADVRIQANLVVEHARKQAEMIVAAARLEREKLVAGGFEQGRKEGFAKGQAEGKTAGEKHGSDAALIEQRAKLDELQGAWKRSLDAFVGVREDLEMDARTNIMRLALCIAEGVVKRTIEADPTVVVEQVRAAVGLVLGPSRLRVAVSAADVTIVEASLPELMSRLGDNGHIEVKIDETMERGGCRVVIEPEARGGDGGGWSGITQVDARIPVQLARIAEALIPGSAQGGSKA